MNTRRDRLQESETSRAATMGDVVHHPVFARLYARLASTMEDAGGRAHREELLSGVAGHLIEVGAGNGLNFSCYPDSVLDVSALEPEAYLRERAQKAATLAPVQIHVIDGIAENLPFDDEVFDVGIASLVLCSVSNPQLALQELHRVLRPGGELRFYEHVRSDDPKRARFQNRANRPWSFMAGGCQTNRRTVESIQKAEFDIVDARHFSFAPSLLCAPISAFVIGRAVRL